MNLGMAEIGAVSQKDIAMTGDRIRLAAGIFVAGWLTCATPAGAPAEDGRTCARGTGDAGIAVCTREIESGKYRGPALAQRYYNRGVGYYQKEDADRAIADFSEAIGSIPHLSQPSSTAVRRISTRTTPTARLRT